MVAPGLCWCWSGLEAGLDMGQCTTRTGNMRKPCSMIETEEPETKPIGDFSTCKPPSRVRSGPTSRNRKFRLLRCFVLGLMLPKLA